MKARITVDVGTLHLGTIVLILLKVFAGGVWESLSWWLVFSPTIVAFGIIMIPAFVFLVVTLGSILIGAALGVFILMCEAVEWGHNHYKDFVRKHRK